LVSDLAGELAPCGCFAGQAGGLDRLARAVSDARQTPVPTVFLSLGELFSTPTHHPAPAALTQDQFRVEALTEILRATELDAAALGPLDWSAQHTQLKRLAALGSFKLLTARSASEVPEPSGVSERLATAATPVIRTSLTLTRAAIRVGIVGFEATVPAANQPTARARVANAASEARLLRRSGVDLVFVLAQGDANDVHELARERAIDLVLVAGKDGESAANSPPGEAPIVPVPPGSQRLTIIDIAERDPERPFRESPSAALGRGSMYRRTVELTANGPREPAIVARIADYYRRVNEHNRSAAARTEAPPLGPHQAGYVGARPCASCHTAAYLWWKGSAHGHAYDSLRQRNAEYNFDCIGCHVTGFEKPGGSSLSRVEPLEDVGCESCHGPGSLHIEDPRDHRLPEQPPLHSCSTCHDEAHSPEFSEAAFVARLRAPGHGLPAR